MHLFYTLFTALSSYYNLKVPKSIILDLCELIEEDIDAHAEEEEIKSLKTYFTNTKLFSEMIEETNVSL